MQKQAIPTLEQAYSGTLYGAAGNTEQIVMMEPDELEEIADQPFRAYKCDKLSDLAESIRNNGQQEPCIVRKLGQRYIVLSGRNRKRACELAGCKVKCVVVTCSDAEADLILTDTNLYQRHELLPSELALAYQLQKQAYEAKGERKSTAAVAQHAGETVKTVQRYIKLAQLEPSLLALVDNGRIPVMAGVTLAEKPKSHQEKLTHYLEMYPKKKISLKQADALADLDDWECDNLSDFFQTKDTSESKNKMRDAYEEKMLELLCDTYCRYAAEATDQSELNRRCSNCELVKELNRLMKK